MLVAVLRFFPLFQRDHSCFPCKIGVFHLGPNLYLDRLLNDVKNKNTKQHVTVSFASRVLIFKWELYAFEAEFMGPKKPTPFCLM